VELKCREILWITTTAHFAKKKNSYDEESIFCQNRLMIDQKYFELLK